MSTVDPGIQRFFDEWWAQSAPELVPQITRDLLEDLIYGPKRIVFVHPSRRPWVEARIKAEFGERVEVRESELVNPHFAYVTDGRVIE